MEYGSLISARRPILFSYRGILLIAAVVGAFLGALCARVYWTLLPYCFSPGSRLIKGSLTARLTIPAFFPTLLLLARFCRRNTAFLLAFFGRGAVIAFLLCAGVRCLSPEDAARLIRILWIRCLLPLPVFFYAGGQMLQRSAAQARTGWLLPVLLSYAASFLALIPERLLQA